MARKRKSAVGPRFAFQEEEEQLPKTSLELVTQEFLLSTSLHGLRYIAAGGRYVLERVLWAIVFSAALLASGYFILTVYQQWDSSPIIVTFDAKGLAVDQIDFPTIAICNVNKGSKKKLLEVAGSSRILKANLSMKELQSIIRLMTRIDAAYLNEGELNPVRDKLEAANFSLPEIRKLILKTVYSCEEMLLHCIWKGAEKECQALFQLRPTDEGFCCVFNSAVFKNLYKNDRRSRNVERSESHGLNLGLTVILDNNLDDYALTTSRYNGFKVLVGHSEEFPDPGKRGFLVGPGMELYTGITPAITSTEPRVESAGLPLEKLMCRFNSFKLKWLPTYTSASCLIECETQAMMKMCGCRPFYYPVSSKLESCNLRGYPCLANVTMMIRRLEIQCGCEDACDNISYHVELSYAVFPGYGFYNGGFLENIRKIGNAASEKVEKFSNRTYNSVNLSRLHFFYKDAYVIHYIRDLRLAWEDFIASTGGLLGLGTGFSLLSGVELIYFFTVKWYSKHKEAKKKKITNSWRKNEMSLNSKSEVKVDTTLWI